MKKSIFKISVFIIFIVLQLSCKEEVITFQGQNSSSVTLEWQNVFGEKDFDDISSVIPTSDGGYIAIGSSLSSDWNYWVLKFDVDLNLLWQKKYGGTNADFGRSIIETKDNDFVIIGYSNSADGHITINHGGYDVWVLKIDALGNILWQKSFGGTGQDYVTEESIVQADIDGYVFSATTNSDDYDISAANGGTDVWVVNINDSANIMWDKSFGGTDDDFSGRIKLTSDSLYYLCNLTNSKNGNVNFNYGGKDVWLLRINQLGDVMWQKTIGGTGTENQSDIDMTSDGGVIVMSQTNSEDGEVQYNYGDKDIWFSKINSSGNVEWNTVFGGSFEEAIGDIHQLEDGSFLSICISASSDYYLGANYGKKDICLVKLTASGTLEWTKVFGGADDEYCNSILPISNNSLLVASVTKSIDEKISGHIGGFDFWFFKVSY